MIRSPKSIAQEIVRNCSCDCVDVGHTPYCLECGVCEDSLVRAFARAIAEARLNALEEAVKAVEPYDLGPISAAIRALAAGEGKGEA